MRHLAALLLLTLVQRFVQTAHKTHLVFMLIRHGARAPAFLSPAFEKLGSEYPKQLTEIGKQQHVLLGKKTLETYFPVGHKNRIQLSTSPSPRCKESMEHFGIGFKVRTDKMIDYEVLPKTFFNQRKLGKFTESQLASFNSKHNETVGELIAEARMHGWDEVREHYCPKCVSQGTPGELIRSLKKLSTIVACHHGNDVETFEIKPELRKVLDKAFRFNYVRLAFQSREEARLYSLDALKLLAKSLELHIGSMARSINKRSPGSIVHRLSRISHASHKAHETTIVFAHDGNVIGFLRLFEKPKEIIKQDFYKPPFASFVKFELIQGFHSTSEYNRYYWNLFKNREDIELFGQVYVRVSYMDREFYLEQCGNETCTLEKFVSVLEGLVNGETERVEK